MPLSELWRLAAGKPESGQQRPCPADTSLPVGNDLVELVWENGQITMQSQSGRGSGGLAVNGLPSNVSRSRDAVLGHLSTSRIGKFGGVEAILDDMSSVVPSEELDLGQDDEMVPWLNYAIGDALPQDYVSDLLPEISDVTGNGMSAQNSFVSVDKRSGCDGTVNNLHSGGNPSKASSSKARPVGSWPALHRQTSDALGSGVSNDASISNMNSHQGAMFKNTARGKEIVNASGSAEIARSSIGLPTNNSNVLNFPYFSRPATLVKANIPNSDGIPTSGSSGGGIDKGWVASASSNPFKSMLVDRSNSAKKGIDFHTASSKIAMVGPGRLAFEAPKDLFAPESSKNLSKEHPSKNDNPVNPSNVANPTKGALEGDRNVDPVVVSSSVGSGNSADRVSCEQTHNSKRKFHDLEESECRSDDVETASYAVKKSVPARGGYGSKRSRAAEVHNLSERRRRDRINEKMRALQELIPNCNKVDKASMLDEAIEYLKTLQLQVQIMSMGAGLCMPPPMMFPAGMQHLHPAHVPPFSPMGMGMGLGFGMGMPDANGRSPSCPIFPVPTMHFPPPMSGPVNFQRFPAPNIPVYGHPSQGLHSSVPRPPLVPVTGQHPGTSATGVSGLRSGNNSEVPTTCPTLNSTESMTDKNSKLKFNAVANSSGNQKPNELLATNEVLDPLATVQKDKQATDTAAPSSLTSVTETDINQETGLE